ncbi:MAG: polyamine aminopropyltransferase [Cytophagales bacterium]|nr:polyamine aminopropyltransferase [Cytophagales bacterium]
MSKKKYSTIVMASLFATGLAGIVAEYILATLATYFLGNAVLQWTMILSVMLFSMGLGSRISRYFNKNLLEKLVIIEFVLSVLASICTLSTYGMMAVTESIGVIIYGFSIAIGLLIGMEIPLATRVNSDYEELRVNIASVMEKDYYGSLLGGVFFAFVGLPFFGLTYTPFILGCINFAVAIVLFIQLKSLIKVEFQKKLIGGAIGVGLIIGISLYFAPSIVLFGEQSRYEDKIIYEEQTPYQLIKITERNNIHRLIINDDQQLNTSDEYLYHEPLVHPVMKLTNTPKHVLILGAGDGCAVREVLKYPSVEKITLVDLDPAMTRLASSNPIFTELNKNAFQNQKVNIVHADAFNYLEDNEVYFDVMIIDFPDPKTVDLNRLYTHEFYKLCAKRLRSHGAIITQAISPYFTPSAFQCVERTVKHAGFHTLPIHNHVMSFGEWGWIIGSKKITSPLLKERLQAMQFDKVETKWLTHDAMSLITSFGKDIIKLDSIEVNSIHNPILYRYYERGQ